MTIKSKILAEMRVPSEVAPFWDRHGARSVDAITKFLAPCGNVGEKLGALGVLAQVLLAYGDSLQALELNRTANGAAN